MNAQQLVRTSFTLANHLMRNVIRTVEVDGIRCAEIVLRGKAAGTALVDLADVERVRPYCWYARKRKGQPTYAHTPITVGGKRKFLELHRLVMEEELADAEPGSVVDHISRDGRDNRRRNLRVVSSSVNNANRRMKGGKASQYNGVSRYQGSRWQAELRVGDVKYWLGAHEDEVLAARLWDAAVRRYGGDPAKLNFEDAEDEADVLELLDRYDAEQWAKAAEWDEVLEAALQHRTLVQDRRPTLRSQAAYDRARRENPGALVRTVGDW